LALALIALVLLPGLALAQGEEKKPDAVAEWVNTLVAKMGTQNEVVSRSVDRAILTVGEAAVPALEKVAKSDNSSLAEKAKGLLERIKNPRQRGNRGRGGEGGRGRGGEGGRGRGRGGFGMRRDPFEGLKLSEEQQTKVDKIKEKQTADMGELREALQNGELERSEIREAFTEVREKMNKEVKKVLTEEQWKKYEEASQRGRGRRRGGDG
ncbi:MAG: hypothetical protein CL908_26860, partial [Deltaproteobacteria bacterium]|nr:hypothetical protein [Deltaproteobacteria bacterium]